MGAPSRGTAGAGGRTGKGDAVSAETPPHPGPQASPGVRDAGAGAPPWVRTVVSH